MAEPIAHLATDPVKAATEKIDAAIASMMERKTAMARIKPQLQD